MNQDSSFPPMLPPSTELGAILFAVLPCLQETYRPLASFAYHMTELTRMKTIPSVPPLTGLSGIDALITDKDIMLRSLSFYGRMFRMPLLSTIATLLQGMQFYQNYKDILPGLFSGMGAGGDSGSPFGGMNGLSPDLFSMLGGLSPDLLSSLFSGFSSGFTPHGNVFSSPSPESTGTTAEPPLPPETPTSANVSDESIQSLDNSSTSDSDEFVQAPNAASTDAISPEPPSPDNQSETTPPSDELYDTLYSFLTPEQQKIYEQLMHTD